MDISDKETRDMSRLFEEVDFVLEIGKMSSNGSVPSGDFDIETKNTRVGM